MDLKMIKTKVKICKLNNSLLHSIDTILVLGVISICVTLTITAVGHVVQPIKNGVVAGSCIFSIIVGEYLKRKEQPNNKK